MSGGRIAQAIAGGKPHVAGLPPGASSFYEPYRWWRGQRTLRDAIAAQREALHQRERFRQALRDWLQSGRSDQYLLQGVRLAEARNLAERDDVAMRDQDGQSFLMQSSQFEQTARSLELRRARRGQLILALVAGVAVVFAFVALGAAYSAVGSQQQAEQLTQIAQNAANARATAEADANLQRDAAETAKNNAIDETRLARSRQFAAESATHLADQLDLALLLSVRAYRTEDTFEARSSQLSALEFSPALLAFLRPGGCRARWQPGTRGRANSSCGSVSAVRPAESTAA